MYPNNEIYELAGYPLMKYPREFFEVNLRFALKVSEITQDPLENTLLHYTNLYIRFGIGRDFNINDPIWQEFLMGFYLAEDTTEWTYKFYLRRIHKISIESHSFPFGCFSYALVSGNRIRLHFHNNEPPKRSPLSQDLIEKRLSELKNMFVAIKRDVHNPTNVIGASWLYNLKAYRRLFPPSYLATAEIDVNAFPFLPLWGQFIDHTGGIKEDLVTQFGQRLNQQHQLDDLMKCFPYQVLRLESPIQEFYQFYNI